jgi:peroxiredoxin
MPTALLGAVVVLLALILASLWAVLYQLVKQQGRLLLRLEDVERRIGEGTAPASVTAGLQIARPSEAPAGPDPRSLPVGTPFPDFQLRDLEGRRVALADLQGQRALLVHWSTHCGFCDLIAPDLVRLEAAFAKSGTRVVLVSYGEAAENRRKAEQLGLSSLVLLQGQGETIGPFSGLGTPAAYLLDAEGRVARPLAVGADQVPALAQAAAAGRARLSGERDLSASHILRTGLPAGTPAPPFQLQDLRGRTVSLDEYRGRRVLLVFSDPQCGPCDSLAPELVKLHREHGGNGLAVVMVGRGDPEENRRKATEHGFEFPVVLQEQWKLSKEYGIFATPVAFLIDGGGVISHQVAQGADEIVSLARQSLAS